MASLVRHERAMASGFFGQGRAAVCSGHMGSNPTLVQKIHEVPVIVVFVTAEGELSGVGNLANHLPGRISFRRTGSLIKEAVCRPLPALLFPGSVRHLGHPS